MSQKVTASNWRVRAGERRVRRLGAELRGAELRGAELRGDELRGEDKLTPPEKGTSPNTNNLPDNRAFAIRFHFHPTVKASMLQDGAAVLLRLPGGTGWRLRASGAKVDLAESIYFGTGGAKRTQQVVLSGPVSQSEVTVKWALRQEGGKT